MVVRMVARVEEMMMQHSMKPVVEELNRPRMQKDGHDCAICTPEWKVLSIQFFLTHIARISSKSSSS
ncbi:hypothetical protein KSP40_PGU007117 [Platanthera guangdongensis]|uniref:Uncharacterized protein n=1 Tax=Platanthera guangdongensis TaxID=2320717 RepID=A0ABR2LCV8_9ASPA